MKVKASVMVRAVIHFHYPVEVEDLKDCDDAAEVFYEIDGDEILKWMAANPGLVDTEFDVTGFVEEK